jgi:hypothetical protein
MAWMFVAFLVMQQEQCWTDMLTKTLIVRGLHGAKGLAHYNDVDGDTKVPQLDCLGTHTTKDVEGFLEKLFVVSIPAFQPSGHLHVVL